MHPRTAGPYTLLRVLGGGGMGRVHLARTDKGARVAVKIIRSELAGEPEFRARLREEVDRASRVRGPRVAALIDSDTEGEVCWLASEYVPGLSLWETVAEIGPLPVDAVRRLGIGLAEALETIHGAGLVHRSLTPGNVLVTAEGPRVTDIGLSRAAAVSPITRRGALVGLPGYLAPEQILGDAQPASDVFALGSVLIHAATWREPFGRGDTPAVLHRVLHVGPNLAGIAPEIAPVLVACLHRDPAQRPTPRQLRETLTTALTERSTPPMAPPATAPPPIPVPQQRRRRAASVAAVSVVLLGVLAGAAADTTPEPPPGLGAAGQ
jgi:serine/threonine protein kinase